MCIYRQGTVVNRINLPVQGAVSVIYGGPNLDILYVLVDRDIIDFDTAQVAFTVNQGSYLYAITGLGARTFVESATRLEIQDQNTY